MKPEMDALKVPILPVNQSSPSSTLTNPKSKPTKSIIMLIVATVALTSWVGASLLSSNSHLLPSLCSVIIDAGSSGTRVHVFMYRYDSGKPVFNFGDANYAKNMSERKLSAYANDLVEARKLVTELVEFANNKCTEKNLEKTDIRLMATAGMRRLDETDQKKILNACISVLGSSGFNFIPEWADIISGSDEGKYAWVIANHALGSLGHDSSDTTGIVELGGASAQVTFALPSDSKYDDVESHRVRIPYENVDYIIYSHSLLGYGKDAALKKLMVKLQKKAKDDTKVPDPCTPKGYKYNENSHKYSSTFLSDESKYKNLVAAGNFEECQTETSKLLKGRPPPLLGNFLATANFFYTAKFFDLPKEDWLTKLREKGTTFCDKKWSELEKEYKRKLKKKYNEEYLRGYCFSSAYIISMLEWLGVSERIKYANNAGEEKIPLDWALGAFILNTATESAPAPAPSPTSNYGGNSRNFLGLY